MVGRWRARFDGPPFALPRRLDGWSERWWRLPPRVRLSIVAVAVALALTAIAARTIAHPYGPPTAVVVAQKSLEPGAVVTPADVGATHWPRDLVPPGAITDVAAATGAIVRGVIGAGTPITMPALAASGFGGIVPTGTVAVAVPRDRLVGLAAGDVIDIVAPDGHGGGVVVASGSRILRVDRDVGWVAVDTAAGPTAAGAIASGRVVVTVRSAAHGGPPT